MNKTINTGAPKFPRLLFKIDEVASMLGIGPSKVRKMIQEGELRIIRLGTARKSTIRISGLELEQITGQTNPAGDAIRALGEYSSTESVKTIAVEAENCDSYCPFHHEDTGENCRTCTSAKRLLMTTSETPPNWCPLRAGAVVVELGEID